ncbi:hypothetical protein [Spiroplasma alleghenense]|uniref:Acetyltransferase n=1 Tax=Spiroplasma alleghenense TaxID=216931 RepID=A0A345Z2L0_9MOLU|nr:hypothetical protein [Spiroplasma alleghenense]AXK50839.1 hypothetical protein SALLE_v1c01630 [Spiroplasma alleghenense]
MAKTPKKEINLSEVAPKKGIIQKLFNKHSERKTILSKIREHNVKNFLFYTNVDNIYLILENGIRLLSQKNLKKGEEYTVWTYLENDNSIGLEFDSSTRASFWKWALEAGLSVEEVGVIGINPAKLAENTIKDWSIDENSNIVYVYENIPVKTIEWIMVKDRKNLDKIKVIVESNDLDIAVYFGEKGNIKEVGKK